MMIKYTGLSHDLGTSVLSGWENPFGENWHLVHDACLCLDGPAVRHFIDALQATVDPGGGDIWTWAGIGG